MISLAQRLRRLPSGAGGNFLVDQYPGALIAYSLREVASEASSAIRVRRSSDNAELNFTPAQITDGTLLSWCGSGSGFVTTLYDQSGNGYHATQTVTANQPAIVTNGAIETVNGSPAIYTNGSSTWLNFPASGGTITQFTWINVMSSVSGNYPMTFYGGNGDVAGHYIGYEWSIAANSIDIFGGYGYGSRFTQTGLDTRNVQKLFFCESKSTNTSNLWWNGNAVPRTLLKSNVAWNLVDLGNVSSPECGGIGRIHVYSNSLYGASRFQELLFYPSDQTANRIAMETNVNDYYGVY